MHCPFCKAEDTRVSDSRLVADGDQIRRRRECAACGARFTTYETAALQLPRVIKRDGTREAFSEEKLRAGLLRALEKRPVKTEDLEAALERIRQQLWAAGESEVPSMQLGELVMHELKKLDQVAYIRFASVYRQFKDINEFRAVIEQLVADPALTIKKSS